MDIILNVKQETVRSLIVATFRRFSTAGTRASIITSVIHGITEVLKDDMFNAESDEAKARIARSIFNINETRKFSTGI